MAINWRIKRRERRDQTKTDNKIYKGENKRFQCHNKVQKLSLLCLIKANFKSGHKGQLRQARRPAKGQDRAGKANPLAGLTFSICAPARTINRNTFRSESFAGN